MAGSIEFGRRPDHPQGTVELFGHDSSIRTVAFSPNARTMVTGSEDGSARLWKLDQANPAGNEAFRSGGRIQCTTVSPDGRWLVVGRKAMQSRLWKLKAGQGLSQAVVLKNGDGLGMVAFSPDSRWLVGTSAVPNFTDERGFTRNDHVAHVWDLKSTEPEKQAFELPHGGAVTSLAFDGEGKRLVTGCVDGIARVWNMSDEPGKQLTWSSPQREDHDDNQGTPLEGEASRQMVVAVSEDGSTIASAGGKGKVLVWNLDKTPFQPVSLTGMKECVLAVDISPDGRWVAAGGGYDKHSYVWDLQSKTLNAGIRIPGHIWNDVCFVTNVVFSPDGRWLATASWDDRTILFDLRKPKPFAEPARVFEDPSFGGKTVSFSRDSHRLISGGTIIDLSHYPGKTELFELPVENIRATALTPNGKRAITGTPYEVRIWDLEIGEMLTAAKKRVGIQ